MKQKHRTWRCTIALLPKLATKLWVCLEIYRVHDAMPAQGRRDRCDRNFPL